MKSTLLLLVLANFCFAQSQISPSPSQDSLSLSHVHKLDAGPQVGLGLGVGTEITLFGMAGWQFDDNFAIEGRYNATIRFDWNAFLAGTGGWSLLFRRQLPAIDCYLFAGPAVEYSVFNVLDPANPYGDFFRREYTAYYLSLGGGWGLHWFSVELDAMVPVQSVMRTPPPPAYRVNENPPAGKAINPFAVYLVVKPHLDLFFFH